LFGNIGYGDDSISSEILRIVSLVAVIGIASFVGSYTTAKNSTRKDKLHVIITALVLLILFLKENVPDLTEFSFEEYLLSVDIFIFTLFGGWIAIKHKKPIA
jgi:multisubunit Na+/H+ antiporter MnhG subunit